DERHPRAGHVAVAWSGQRTSAGTARTIHPSAVGRSSVARPGGIGGVAADSADGPRSSRGHQRGRVRALRFVGSRACDQSRVATGARRLPRTRVDRPPHATPRQRRAHRPERELLVNRTSRGGTDGVVWLSGKPREHWGYTLLGGAHWQER